MSSSSRQAALDLLQIADEAAARLDRFEALIRRWQGAVNLVSRTDFADLWLRHIADLGQLLKFAPAQAKRWVDIGSGAGFPGAVLAILLAADRAAVVHLIESDRRKAAFLRTVSRETDARAVIHNTRAETVLGSLSAIDVVTSRATASLADLLDWSRPLLLSGATGLFLKGESARHELTAVRGLDRFSVTLKPS